MRQKLTFYKLEISKLEKWNRPRSAPPVRLNIHERKALEIWGFLQENFLWKSGFRCFLLEKLSITAETTFFGNTKKSFFTFV